ncbi:heme-binding protein [Halomonas sabkhae]|uniref:GlcG protein n=1 Tax=Halomonas halmophila TaxID=252 RepID=A0A4Y4F455_9GAMM|nr:MULTISPECIES: heme-binding protein [Halomonas]MDN3524592.1 heme-binding protein [Halomonas sabkhae]GED22390.1 hypothetical protein HHA01_13670 [Halomonas halmophila]
MKTKAMLELADVNAILDAAQREAEANQWAVTIAVADDSGELLGLRRLDGAAATSAMIGTRKARTAALSGKETRVFEHMINEGRTAFLSVPLEGLLEGGIPVIVDGQPIAAIGVSGVKPEQDARVARAGLAAVA